MGRFENSTIKGSNHPFWGKQRPESTKAKIRLANLGKKTSLETIEKLRSASLGKKHSDKTKEKLSLITKGENNAMFNKLNVFDLELGEVIKVTRETYLKNQHRYLNLNSKAYKLRKNTSF